MKNNKHEKHSQKDDTTIDQSRKRSIKSKLAHLFRNRKRKITAGVCVFVVVMATLAAIPQTRYGILGTFIKRDLVVHVLDSSTKKSVSEATVYIAGISANTNSKGDAKFTDVPLGEHKLTVKKKYYKQGESVHTLPVWGDSKVVDISIQATGRQVTLHVENKITNQALAGALVKVGGTSAKTNDKGDAVVVLPADKKSLKGVIELSNYNKETIEIKVTEKKNENTFGLVPAGKIYYLSKITGKINVMQSNLDGSDAKVVVEGTGNEADVSTALLASRDWRYLALLAKRDANVKGQLYLIDTKTNKLEVIDQGEAEFSLIGWSGHRFLYKVFRDIDSWQPNRQALKSYNSDSHKLSTIDQTEASGSASWDALYEDIYSPYIVEGKLLYIKKWEGEDYLAQSKQSAIMSINTDGANKKRIKEFGYGTYVYSKLYEPKELYFQFTNDFNDYDYYEYENGEMHTAQVTSDQYNSQYPTFLVSPSDKRTLWHEPRDGKNTIIVGDENGNNTKTLATLSDFASYGWYGDEYVLLSKNGSELYIASSTKPFTEVQPLKVTNYHKSSLIYPGYGYGYGGI